jgi:hypothetical protein
LIGSLIKYFPGKFNRKGRSSHNLGRWKATDLGNFLVYTGLVILKEVLPEESIKIS